MTSAAATLSSLVLLVLVGSTVQGLSYDSTWQARALQQFLAGASPSLNHLVQPSPANLAVDEAAWIVWWAPGPTLLAYPLAATGFSLGDTYRLLALGCLLAGALGWARWIGRFGLPGRVALLLSAAVPWVPYVSNAFLQFAPDALVFAMAPWMLLATLWLRHRLALVNGGSGSSIAAPAAVGLLLGSAFVVKYSMVFVSLGALAYLAWDLKSRRGRWSRFLAVALPALAPVVGLTLLNQRLGGAANLVAAQPLARLDPESLLHLLTNAPLAALGLDSMLRFVALQLGGGGPWRDVWIGLLGLPGAIALLHVGWRSRASWLQHQPSRLAASLLGASLVCLAIVWAVSANVSYDGRHIASASLAVLPGALAGGRRVWPVCRTAARALLLGSAAIYVVAPPLISIVLMGGLAAAAPKRAEYAAGPSALYSPLLGPAGPLREIDTLVRQYGEPTDIWYVAEPSAALDLPGRVIVDDSARTGVVRLPLYSVADPTRVVALYPVWFDAPPSRLGETLRGRFPGVNWRCSTHGPAGYVSCIGS